MCENSYLKIKRREKNMCHHASRIDMDIALKNCREFLAWSVEQGWSEEQIYYVVRIVLALLKVD
ncbi:hypothetical protein BFP46_25105 [Bacillus licheniformis]|nr:hypothetical protein BFP47_04345 [Bacillus licheniformis]OJT66427.1 hypothetical protein BFP46_25105 [Bacillus licheniformis]